MNSNVATAAAMLDPAEAEPVTAVRLPERRRLRLVEPLADEIRPPTGVHRVLHATAVASLDDYRAAGGLRGLDVAAAMDPASSASPAPPPPPPTSPRSSNASAPSATAPAATSPPSRRPC
jgi:hypothetical protein